MDTILIGGQARPFHVGTNMGAIFCDLQHLTLAQYGNLFANINELGMSGRRDFLYAALRAGAERLGQAVDFSVMDVGDWMDAPDFEQVPALGAVISALGRQFEARAAYAKEREKKARTGAEAPAEPVLKAS